MNKKIPGSFKAMLLLSLLATFLTVLTGCADSSFAPEAISPGSASGLSVHYIDVGQGDSMLIQSSGRSMLIDTGTSDQSEKLLKYLSDQGVTRFDYVIGTHPDSDHIGSLDIIIDKYEIGTLLMPPREHTTRTFEDVLDAAANKRLKITKPSVGTVYQLGDASFEIIAPNQDYGDDNNNWSIGIKLVYGENRFIMCGDAEAEAELDICNEIKDLSADVLKLGHHGSRTSSTEEFLDRVKPEYAVISCGKGNTYGHPSPETLKKLKSRNIKILRTDEQGTIIARSDGKKIIWNTTPDTSELSSDDTSSAPENPGYILNTNTKKFHRINCPSAEDISDENKEAFQGTREKLIQKGYEPCKRCNP